MKFADNTVLVAENEEEAYNLLQELKTGSEKSGLTINKKKIKVLTFSLNKEMPRCELRLDNQEIEQITRFEH